MSSKKRVLLNSNSSWKQIYHRLTSAPEVLVSQATPQEASHYSHHSINYVPDERREVASIYKIGFRGFSRFVQVIISRAATKG